MPQSYIKRILDARVYDVASETPVQEATLMSRRLGNRWSPEFTRALNGLEQAADGAGPGPLKYVRDERYAPTY